MDDNGEFAGTKARSNVDYMLRTAQQSFTQLSVAADQKANILVGILAVMLTIMFTKSDLLADISGTFLVPIACFIVLEVAALILALLVIMPKTIGRPNGRGIENIANPFFFGFFTMYSEEEYLGYLSRRMNDNGSARHLLARDLYQTGFVLRKKYALLKYTYLLAVTGIILLALSTVLSLFIR